MIQLILLHIIMVCNNKKEKSHRDRLCNQKKLLSIDVTECQTNIGENVLLL